MSEICNNVFNRTRKVFIIPTSSTAPSYSCDSIKFTLFSLMKLKVLYSINDQLTHWNFHGKRKIFTVLRKTQHKRPDIANDIIKKNLETLSMIHLKDQYKNLQKWTFTIMNHSICLPLITNSLSLGKHRNTLKCSHT